MFQTALSKDVSEQEVSDVIKSLNNSSAGWDQFPTSIAMQYSKNFVKPLTALINRSFREGICPTELKRAKVVPIKLPIHTPPRVLCYSAH